MMSAASSNNGDASRRSQPLHLVATTQISCGDPFSVAISPFDENLFAVAAAENYGIHGLGGLVVKELYHSAADDAPTFRNVITHASESGINDVCWNEANRHQVLTAEANGTVAVHRADDSGRRTSGPIVAKYDEHTEAAVSVSYNFIDKDHFASASLDGTVKLWDGDKPGIPSLATFENDGKSVWEVHFSPHEPHELVSCGSCGKLRLWDVRSASPEALRICAHDDEATSCSYDASHEHGLLSASLDRSIRYFDRRFAKKGGGDGQTTTPVLELRGGHNFGARRIKSHPHKEGIFGSVGEEGRVLIWEQHEFELQDHGSGGGGGGGGGGCGNGDDGGSVLAVGNHSEAATAIDFSVLLHGRAVTCGWDGKLRIWDLDHGGDVH